MIQSSRSNFKDYSSTDGQILQLGTFLVIQRILFPVFLLAQALTGRASASCPGGLDPYDQLDWLYSFSELVFVGHALQGPITRQKQIEYSVDAIWKGPNIKRVWLNQNYPRKIREGERRLIFASPDRYTQDGVWTDNLPSACMPRTAYPNMESMLIETVGEPHPMETAKNSWLEIILVSAIFLGVGGITVFLWSMKPSDSGSS